MTDSLPKLKRPKVDVTGEDKLFMEECFSLESIKAREGAIVKKLEDMLMQAEELAGHVDKYSDLNMINARIAIGFCNNINHLINQLKRK